VSYLEYHAVDPESAYSKTQHFYLARKFLKKSRLAMRQQYVAGEVLFIDYAGTKACYSNAGETVWLKVFVACLGASKKLFAFATASERTIDWLNGMTRALDYFGGVPEFISIDNAKALVSKPGLVPVLIKNIELFGEHHVCIIDACRVGMPQDKALVELGVKFVKQRILIPMNADLTFHSIDELNAHLAKEVEKLNNLPLQKLDVSRNQLFDELERSELKKLPSIPFEAICDFKTVKVPPTYHILVDQHEYSVPHKLTQEAVNIFVTQTHVKVEYDNQLVATHLRSDEKGGCTTLYEHMPAQHQAESLKSKEEYVNWAQTVGSNTQLYVQELYRETKNPKSRAIGKQCQSLMKLFTDKENTAIEKVCDYALRNQIKPAEMRLVVSAIDDLEPEEVPTTLLVHQNIRGKGSYGGRYEN